MQTRRAIVISRTGPLGFAVAYDGEAAAIRGDDEVDAARMLLELMRNLPVIAVRVEGGVPGLEEPDAGLYHMHAIREALAGVIERAALLARSRSAP